MPTYEEYAGQFYRFLNDTMDSIQEYADVLEVTDSTLRTGRCMYCNNPTIGGGCYTCSVDVVGYMPN